MSFHLLNFYLKTGRFLAITPPSTEIREHSKCRQIYQVLMIVGLVMGTLGSTYYYKEAFSDFNFVKIAALILAEWMLCAFSCRIIVEASRMRGWRRLIKDLKETSCLVQDEEVHTRKVLFKFLGPQIIFWVCCICNVWFAVSVVGVIFIKFSSVEIFEIYFFYTLYICTLLEMIRKRYEGLRRRYEHRFLRNRRHLVQMSGLACSLNKIVDTFNDNFGYSLVLLICYVTLESLNYLDFNLEEYSNEYLIELFVSQVLSVLLLFVPTLMMILTCDNIVEESQKIIFLVSHSTLGIVDCEMRQDLDRLLTILTTSVPHFTAARFFSINKSTIFSIFGTVTSFLIIMLTLDPTQPNCIVKTNLTET
ncbi:hypothetical protein MTP99_004156 [Tenebrio molitor]|nr:hypothetical protein MTP99_004156 [Tenebrio molitor]